jgi:hypothetical protein
MDPQQEPSDAYWYLTTDEVESEIVRRVRLLGDDAYDTGFSDGRMCGAFTVIAILIAAEIVQIVSNKYNIPVL